MDAGALSAIALAGNILQFIDWVVQTLEVSNQLREKGGTKAATNLKDVAEVLAQQIRRLAPDDHRLTCNTEAEQSLRRISNECTEIAKELLAFVAKFKISDLEKKLVVEKLRKLEGERLHSRMQKIRSFYDGTIASLRKESMTFAKAVQFMWSKDDLESLTTRLENHRKLLFSEVLIGIRESTTETAEQLQTASIRQVINHQETIAAVKTGNTSLADSLSVRTDGIHRQLALFDEASRERDIEILNAIKSFVQIVEDGQRFPVLPSVLTRYDPALKTPALHGSKLIEDTVLGHLQFRRMNAREAEVREAYEKTCSWVFQNTSFASWLERGEGLFWIEGKAGCGKSTLMKLVNRDERTLRALLKWCDSGTLITGSYFFWLAGSNLQKNQEGLLRSLLHGILDQRRDLISKTFPEMYNTMMSRLFFNNESPKIFFACDESGCGELFKQPSLLQNHQESVHHRKFSSRNDPKPGHISDSCGILTLTELKTALLTIIRELPKDVKVCLFIDGLDEYHGNHRDIIELFQLAVARSKNVKAVVSSRPERVFKESLREYPSIRMEDLTRADINRYVRGKLLCHQRMQELQTKDFQGAEELFNSIVSKSSGVFLWVFLAVRSLIEGLDDWASLAELHKLSEDYPEELQDVYDQMLARMNPRHKLQGLQLLLSISLVQATEDSLPTLLRLYFISQEPASSLTAEIQQLPRDDLKEILTMTQHRVQSRCCGLIEVSSLDGLGEIKFLHRTVSEFLREMAPVMEKEVPSNLCTALLASTLYTFKVWDFFTILTGRSFANDYQPMLKGFFVHSSKMMSEWNTNPAPYIYEYDRALKQFWQFQSRQNMPGKQDIGHWADSIPGFRAHRQKTRDVDPLVVLAKQYGLAGALRDYRQTKRTVFLDDLGDESMEAQATPLEFIWKTQEALDRSYNYYAGSTASREKSTKAQTPGAGKSIHRSKKTIMSDPLTGIETTRECGRCKLLQHLVEMGFSHSDVLEALDEAKAGNDLGAVLSWLLDHKSPATTTGPASLVNDENGNKMDIEVRQPMLYPAPPEKGGKNSSGSRRLNSGDCDTSINAWRIVSRPPQSSASKQLQVVGNHGTEPKLTEPIKQKKHRRSKRQPDTESLLTSGQLLLGGAARMTWFLDLDDCPGGDQSKGLNRIQLQRLEELLGEFLAERKHE